MAIQMRRGEYGKFDPEKLLPAEWAVVLSGDPNTQDGRAAYLCFDAGNVKRMVTQEDLQKDIEMAVGDIKDTVVKESIEKVKEDALDSKVDKVTGKGLSTNDYTTAEKNKLTGIETGANKYVHPSYTAKTNGLYKVTVDAAGHVSSTTPVTKTDITGLGIPASNTTYSDFKGATANAAGTHGLVPAPAKGDTGKLLSGKGTWEAMTMAYTEEDYTQASVGLTFAGSTVKAIIPVATTGNMGLMSPAMFSKLNDLPTEADLSGIYAKKSDITGVYKYKGSLADATKLPTTGQVAGDVYNLEAASDYGPAGTNVAWDGKAWDALGGLFVVDALTNAEIDAICV